MSRTIEPANISFNQHGIPVSAEFDDIYFSNQDGAAESRYVFLQGNYLPERFINWPAGGPFVIAETGFGSGLNMLQAAHLFMQHAPAKARLHLISFERYPMQAAQLQQALSHWPELDYLSQALCSMYPPLVKGLHRIQLTPQITLDLYLGDVLDALPDWAAANPERVHAWFLDGFAPSKNPQMWQPELYQAMYKSAAGTCTVATFTAAGAVRRGLIKAGFAMRKQKGFGHKRDMLTGQICRPAVPQSQPRTQQIVIIGAGIAAASVARLLAEHAQTHPGLLQITVLCADNAPAQGASGNAQGAVYPLLQADYTTTTQFYTQAFTYARTFYNQFIPQAAHWSGLIQLGFNEKMRLRQQHIIARTQYPDNFVRAVNSESATRLSGLPLEYGGLYYPTAGWVEPSAVVSGLLAHDAIKMVYNAHVNQVTKEKTGWRVNTKDSSFIADHVIWATGAELTDTVAPQIEIRPAGGQVSYVSADEKSQRLKTVICHKGYITPAHQQVHSIGATFTKLKAKLTAKLTQQSPAEYINDTSSVTADNAENLALHAAHTQLKVNPQSICGQRRSVRATTPDHLPLVGRHPAYDNGIWIIGGLGARGFTSAPWCAQLLADALLQGIYCSDQTICQALTPDRFIKRAQARPART